MARRYEKVGLPLVHGLVTDLAGTGVRFRTNCPFPHARHGARALQTAAGRGLADWHSH